MTKPVQNQPLFEQKNFTKMKRRQGRFEHCLEQLFAQYSQEL